MKTQNWIKSPENIEGAALAFRRKFSADKKIVSATLHVSSLGIYKATLNGERVGTQILTPGVTNYDHRVQYQSYDVTSLIGEDNLLEISVGPGWAVGHYMLSKIYNVWGDAVEAVCELEMVTNDGEILYINTDETWQVYTTEVTYTDIYCGEVVDKTAEIRCIGNAVPAKAYTLVPQVGADIVENEILRPEELIITPKGEKVIDFGQNMTGYISLKIKGNRGDRVVLSFGEVLDKDGNFYNENYRTAAKPVVYVLSGEEDSFKPTYTFQGFRYIRLDEYPFENVELSGISAVVVHSKMERTGRFVCGNDRVNQLYHNVIWGQKGNYLDIPTDCPQRDERLGWTGDAEVFCRTAAINYDVQNFFRKWLGDVAIEQTPEGGIRGVVPTCGVNGKRISTAWGDVATVCPWEIYKAYGDKELLRENYPMMKKWVEYMHAQGEEEFLWLGGNHYGDWLAMDAGYGIYIGATQTDFIASAFFAFSTDLVIKAGKVLGEDTTYFEELYKNVRAKFREIFMKDGMPIIYPKYNALATDRPVKAVTQTAITLILQFRLYEESEKAALADKLVELIRENDGRMTTGFVGTPYILHALSDHGKVEEAFDLLLQEKNPSWLFSVNRGATTIWEHWDSIDEDYNMWSTDMNSFNHYAYGSVCDWIFGDMLGIKIAEDGAAYTKVEIAPLTDKRIGFAEGSIDTRNGKIFVSWRYIGDKVRYEISVPANVEAKINISGMSAKTVKGGAYTIVK